MKKSRRFVFCLISFISFLVVSKQAQADAFPLPSRLSINTYASDYAVGQLDLMLPIKGDQFHHFYFSPIINYGTDNQVYADFGVGYRWIENNTSILGYYLFGGYTRINNNARLWVANPGLEALGSYWDVHLNAYFPMGDRHYTVADFSTVSFSGHSELENFFHLAQYTGNGADVKIGYQFFPQSSLKGYLGSYYFVTPQTNNIWGGAAGVEYWFTRQVRLFAAYTFDNVRFSTLAIGLGVEMGGTHAQHRSDPCLEERFTDPVERYLSGLGKGSAIPAHFKEQVALQRVVANNIAFFSLTGFPNNGGTSLTMAHCTFEEPCGPTDFSQKGVNTLADLLPDTQMFFNGGRYPALGFKEKGPITLNTGQSVHSRTKDYSQLAIGNSRSQFNGAFSLSGNNTLDHIILLPSQNGGDIGVSTKVNANHLVITGSQIGSEKKPFSRGFLSSQKSSVSINHSDIFANYRGIVLSDALAPVGLNLQNSRINVKGTDAIGVLLINTVANLENNQISISGIGDTFGISSQQSSVANVNGTTVHVVNQTRALATFSNGMIRFKKGVLSVLGNVTRLTNGGSNIQITDSTIT